MQGAPSLRPAERLRHGEVVIACDPDAIQQEPAALERFASLPHRMLQRERGEGTPVATSPRLLSRMIEREQCLEALPAAVSPCLVSGTTLIAGVPRHVSLPGPPNAIR